MNKSYPNLCREQFLRFRFSGFNIETRKQDFIQKNTCIARFISGAVN